MTCVYCGAAQPDGWRAPHIDEDGYPARCPQSYDLVRFSDVYGYRPFVALRELQSPVER